MTVRIFKAIGIELEGTMSASKRDTRSSFGNGEATKENVPKRIMFSEI